MPSQNEFDSKLREIPDYVERIGDEVTGEVEGESDGSQLRGYGCDHGGHKYQVIGTVDWEYFILRYPYQVYGDYAVAQKLRNADVPDSGGDGLKVDVDLTDGDIQEAKRQLHASLSQEPEEKISQIRQKMVDALSTPNSAVSFLPDNSRQIHGFNVDTKIFPYSEDFGLSEFNRAVQTVVSLGFKGTEYLKSSYGIGSVSVSQSGAENEGIQDPGFR